MIPHPASKFRVANDNGAQDVNALPAAKLAAAELTLEVTEVNGTKHYAFRFNGEGGKYYVDNTDRGGRNAGDAVHATTDYSTFTIAPAKDANNHGWAIKSTVAGQNRCFLNTGGADKGGLVLYTEGDDNNSLQIYRQVTTVPVRQSDNNTYATFYSDAEVVLPAGVTAYTAKEMATTVQLTAMKGNVLPANTGVLLEAAADAQTVALAHTKTNAPALTDNDFKGVTTATEIGTRNVYVFGKGSKGLGFYKPSATTLKAHAAYIESTSTQASLALSFGGEQTGVEAVETTLQSDAPIYDLSGRRVTKAVKGVYIQGGKKIYIK